MLVFRLFENSDIVWFSDADDDEHVDADGLFNPPPPPPPPPFELKPSFLVGGTTNYSPFKEYGE